MRYKYPVSLLTLGEESILQESAELAVTTPQSENSHNEMQNICSPGMSKTP